MPPKYASLNLRCPQSVRDRLERDAAKHGRSLTKEVISIWERTREGEPHQVLTDDPDMFRLFRALSGIAAMVQLHTGKPWTGDARTAEKVAAAMCHVIETWPVKNQKDSGKAA